MNKIKFSDEELAEVFEYLAELRSSGATNMWGAAPYVSEALGWDDEKSTKALLTWMKVFSRTKDMTTMVMEARAILAM
jgi:hypothetical protein